MPQDITPPTPAELEETFAFIKNSLVQGVPGVWYLESGTPGPTLGITIHTHGNEPSGLAALWYFRNNYQIEKLIKRGSIYFILNNIEATEQYFTALRMPEGEAKTLAKRKARFVHHNMNRLPGDVMTAGSKEISEFRRARELRPIWQKIEIGFDIHSTSTPSVPMIIECGGLQPDLIAGFPIDVVMSNIWKVQQQKGAFSFYGTPGNTRALAIEAGSHENEESFICAINCTIALLRNIGMIEHLHTHSPATYREYYINRSVLFPNESYELVKTFVMFEKIHKGQILAEGSGTPIVAAEDGHVLMPPPTKKPICLTDEVMFISQPVRNLTA